MLNLICIFINIHVHNQRYCQFTDYVIKPLIPINHIHRIVWTNLHPKQKAVNYCFILHIIFVQSHFQLIKNQHHQLPTYIQQSKTSLKSKWNMDIFNNINILLVCTRVTGTP